MLFMEEDEDALLRFGLRRGEVVLPLLSEFVESSSQGSRREDLRV
jgi:hypothetical protein